MAHKYLVISWQGLLQYVVKSLIGKGYYHWHVTELPVHKQSKWGEIDKKLIKKYKTDIDKFKRHRRKARGEANFIYIRWEQYALIFHTEGAISADVDYSDKFNDIRQEPLFLRVGEVTVFRIEIAGNGKVMVALSKDTYQGFKAMIHNVSKRKNPMLLKSIFKQMNGIPSYAGILRQKKQLVDFAIKQAEKHDIRIDGRKMNRQDFWIYTKTPTVQVFHDAPFGGGQSK